MHSVKLDGVEVTWLGHASFLIRDGTHTIYVDPFVLPDNPDKADIIFVTHDHFDHCDESKIASIRQAHTIVLGPAGVTKKLGFGTTVHVSDHREHKGVYFQAVEAYNTNKFRSPGQPFHPRGLGVGFVVKVAGKRIYHAGDTDHIEEMSHLKDIDLALLPAGGTYTMTHSEAAAAAQDIKPKHVVPMHYNSDKYGVEGLAMNPADFARLLVGKGIVVNVLQPVV